MKLRIHGNSLRLRLNGSEIEQLRNTGLCSHTLQFGSSSRLTYTLETSSQLTEMDAQYRQDCIRILLPLHLALEWTESDRISLSLDRTDGRPSLLIEKDLPCAHREADASKNEAAGT